MFQKIIYTFYLKIGRMEGWKNGWMGANLPTFHPSISLAKLLMKPFGLIIIILIVISVALGCASKKPITPEETLLHSKCASCHLSPQPAEFSKTKWDSFKNKHKDKVKLDEKEWTMLKNIFFVQR